MLRYASLDFIDRNATPSGPEHVGKRIFGERFVDRPVVERSIGYQTVQPPFELANVRGNAAGKQIANQRWNLLWHGIGFCLDDSAAQSVVGRLNVDHKPLGQTRKDAAFDPVELVRAAVGTDDQPSSATHQLVDGIQEFLLRSFLAGYKLKIIDHQQVNRTQPRFERQRILGPHRMDEIDHEPFCRHGERARSRLASHVAMAGGVEQMGLALPGWPVDKKRIEPHRPAFGDRSCGIVCNAIRVADQKCFERQARVELENGLNRCRLLTFRS